MDDQLRHYLEVMESRLIERMRDMQSELLRGLEAFSSGQIIRLRKLEADQSNLDTAAWSRPIAFAPDRATARIAATE